MQTRVNVEISLLVRRSFLADERGRLNGGTADGMSRSCGEALQANGAKARRERRVSRKVRRESDTRDELRVRNCLLCRFINDFAVLEQRTDNDAHSQSRMTMSGKQVAGEILHCKGRPGDVGNVGWSGQAGFGMGFGYADIA
jgi:hypothetical protein